MWLASSIPQRKLVLGEQYSKYSSKQGMTTASKITSLHDDGVTSMLACGWFYKSSTLRLEPAIQVNHSTTSVSGLRPTNYTPTSIKFIFAT